MKNEIRRVIHHGAGVALLLLLLTLMIPNAETQAELDSQLRTHYAIDMTMELPENRAGMTPEEFYQSGAPAATLREKLHVNVVNTSDTVWEEVCFRDFAASVIDHHDSMQDRPSNYQSGVTSAICDGRELVVHTEGEDQSIVYIRLESPLAPGESVLLELTYFAEIAEGGYRMSAFPLCMNGGTGDMTFELGQFYPMLAIWENGRWMADEYFNDGECFYTRCADYDMTVRVPAGYRLIASGDEEQLEPQEGMDVWQVSARNMRDVSLVVSNEMSVLTGERCGVTVNSYFCESEGSRPQGEISLQAAMDAIEAFTEAYGDYPYGELDVVESNYNYGGMEAPGLIRISQLYSWFMRNDSSEAERAEYTERLRSTVAHETAHEWFYAVVGNDQYNEAWLDESLAAYSEQVYWRSVGRDESRAEQVMAEFEARVSESGDQTVDRSYGELDGDVEHDYIRAVYQRGAAFVYRLEQAVGREKFSEFLREYYGEFAFREAHTEDFVRLLTPYIEGNEQAQALVRKYLHQ